MMIKSIPVLEDKFLTLCPIAEKDIELIRLWRNQQWARRQFIFQGIITSEEQKKWYQNYKLKNDDYMWIVEIEGKAIGNVALYNIDFENKKAEFGRLLIGDISYQRRGLSVKIGSLVTRFAATHLKLKELYLEVWDNNLPAIKTYSKMGFLFKGEFTNVDKGLLKKMVLFL